MGGVEFEVEEHPAGGDVAEVVGVPDGGCLAAGFEGPACGGGGPVPVAENLATFGWLAVAAGEQERLVAAFCSDAVEMGTELGGKAGGEDGGAGLVVLGRFDFSAGAGLFDGPGDVDLA